MKSSLYAAYITELIYFPLKITQNITIRIANTLIRSAFNQFPDFFVQVFKIVVDSWEFSMLLL